VSSSLADPHCLQILGTGTSRSLPLRHRVVAPHPFGEPALGDVEIDGGRGDVRVAQDRLDLGKRVAGVQETRGGRVAEDVGIGGPLDAGLLAQARAELAEIGRGELAARQLRPGAGCRIAPDSRADLWEDPGARRGDRRPDREPRLELQPERVRDGDVAVASLPSMMRSRSWLLESEAILRATISPTRRPIVAIIRSRVRLRSPVGTFGLVQARIDRSSSGSRGWGRTRFIGGLSIGDCR